MRSLVVPLMQNENAVPVGSFLMRLGLGLGGSAALAEARPTTAQDERLVVQHLLEVWHVPMWVDRVAGEPAAEMVVDAPEAMASRVRSTMSSDTPALLRR